jgi:hypothetical protein
MKIRLVADENFQGPSCAACCAGRRAWTLFAFKMWDFPARKIRSFWIGRLGRGVSS